jgi:hypothetical protein
MQIDDVSKVPLHIQHNHGQWFCFSNVLFVYQMHTIFFKLTGILRLMIIKAIALEIGKIHL